MYRAIFPGDFLTDFDRLQRQLQRFARPATSIRGVGRGDFPALNIGSTPEAFEVHVFAPGLDPAAIDLTIERGVLTVSGERKSQLPADGKNAAIHINERFSGPFRRAISLADDADPGQVTAKYNDGILHISIKRYESAQRRCIEIH